jgi:hypothetical protein
MIKCLERVLVLDPTHAKAREKLARLTNGSTPAAPQPPQASEAAPSFEAFANDAAPNPFAPPAPNPFAPPAPARDMGDQPSWGPGLAFLNDAASAPPADQVSLKPPKPRGKGDPALEAEFVLPEKKGGIEKVIGVAVIAIALVVFIGLAIFVANKRGLIELWGPPPMNELDKATFAVEYPEDWNVKCKKEGFGYTVCGIANHPFYNQVDYYVGGDVDFASMFASLGTGLLGIGGDLPDTQISVIIMDVPTTSQAYNGASWAKTKYEWSKDPWLSFLSDEAKVVYDKKEMIVDGHTAYYYRYESEDPGSEGQGWRGRDAAYDVYIPHKTPQGQDLMLWMTVSIGANMRDEIPDNIIQDMIHSIDLK